MENLRSGIAEIPNLVRQAEGETASAEDDLLSRLLRQFHKSTSVYSTRPHSIALYFEAGAQEVWTCDQDGTLEFHFSTAPEVRQATEICPEFPSVIRFSGE